MLFYLVGARQNFYHRIGHRAYGPKTEHAERALVFLPPNEYNELRSAKSSVRTRSMSSDYTLNECRRLQKNAMTQYHSLADGYSASSATATSHQMTKIAPGQVLPMKILDKSKVTANVTA